MKVLLDFQNLWEIIVGSNEESFDESALNENQENTLQNVSKKGQKGAIPYLPRSP